jgi:hypothetical protein
MHAAAPRRLGDCDPLGGPPPSLPREKIAPPWLHTQYHHNNRPVFPTSGHPFIGGYLQRSS